MFINISVKNTEKSSFRMERGEEPLLFNLKILPLRIYSCKFASPALIKR